MTTPTAEDLQRKAFVWVVCACVAAALALGVFVWVVLSAILKIVGLL